MVKRTRRDADVFRDVAHRDVGVVVARKCARRFFEQLAAVLAVVDDLGHFTGSDEQRVGARVKAA